MSLNQNSGCGRVVMNIPVGAGAFAPEVLYCNQENDPKAMLDRVRELAVLVESALPAAATIEVELLRVGGSQGTAGDWISAAKNFAAIGLGAVLAMANWNGVRLRGKSGGTAGAVPVSASWS